MIIKQIRVEIFKVSQIAFAKIIGTTQASVSRWERGVHTPNLDDMKRIRRAAIRRRIQWDDRWFFDPPKRGSSD